MKADFNDVTDWTAIAGIYVETLDVALAARVWQSIASNNTSTANSGTVRIDGRAVDWMQASEFYRRGFDLAATSN